MREEKGLKLDITEFLQTQVMRLFGLGVSIVMLVVLSKSLRDTMRLIREDQRGGQRKRSVISAPR